MSRKAKYPKAVTCRVQEDVHRTLAEKFPSQAERSAFIRSTLRSALLLPPENRNNGSSGKGTDT